MRLCFLEQLIFLNNGITHIIWYNSPFNITSFWNVLKPLYTSKYINKFMIRNKLLTSSNFSWHSCLWKPSQNSLLNCLYYICPYRYMFHNWCHHYFLCMLYNRNSNAPHHSFWKMDPIFAHVLAIMSTLIIWTILASS